MESSLMCKVVYRGTLTHCFTQSGIDDVNHNSKLIEEVVLQKDFLQKLLQKFQRFGLGFICTCFSIWKPIFHVLLCRGDQDCICKDSGLKLQFSLQFTFGRIVMVQEFCFSQVTPYQYRQCVQLPQLILFYLQRPFFISTHKRGKRAGTLDTTAPPKKFPGPPLDRSPFVAIAVVAVWPLNVL